MSKINNDVLTRSGTGCIIAVPIWQHWGIKGLTATLSVGGRSLYRSFSHRHWKWWMDTELFALVDEIVPSWRQRIHVAD